MKLYVFATAALVTWILLLSKGAPLFPLIVGTSAVAVWNWRKVLLKR
jgi:hypothetical protein